MNTHQPIIALDYTLKEEAWSLINLLEEEQLNLKVGMEMFYRYGYGFIETLNEAGHHIFLDLKLHDIPNTVKRTMTILAKLGIKMVNVHASGGQEMMEAALEGLEAGSSQNTRPILLAVTQLTSHDSKRAEEEQQLKISLEKSVFHLARLTQKAGLDGVICSPQEVQGLKKESPKLLTVTPGIRLKESAHDDQKRITTPHEAAKMGSDFIVVGRPITRSADPKKSYQEILRQWQKHQAEKGV